MITGLISLEFNYNEETKITEISLDEEDICNNCPFIDVCPLLKGLNKNIVYPFKSSFILETCSLFESIEENITETS